MQLGRSGSRFLSWPFSTFPSELEERSGASPDAWLDTEKWSRFADELRVQVEGVGSLMDTKFNGCFVGTAMNHRAAMYTEIAEIPITAREAVAALKASLPVFLNREGDLYERMMATGKPGSSYPLARITAMHTYRLALVLEVPIWFPNPINPNPIPDWMLMEVLFDPHAQLYFARDGKDEEGKSIDCEWTIGCFAAQEEAMRAVAVPS